MAKDLRNAEDRSASNKISKQTTGRFLRIENGRTPIYILDGRFEEGFVHWVQTPSGDRRRVPCAGGEAGQGFSPDTCPVCAVVLEQYRQAKRMEASGRADAGKQLRKETNRVRGSYEFYVLAAKGEMAIKEIDANGKKRYGVDFSDPEVGLLRLTEKQKKDFFALPGKHSYIEDGSDLLNRYIIMDKQIRDDSDFPTVEFIPAKKPTPKPEVDLDDDELSLEELFAVDMSELQKMAKVILGEDVDSDDEVEFEGEEEDSDTDEEVTFDDEEEESDGIEENEEIEEDDSEDGSVDFTVEDDSEDDDPTSDFDSNFLDDVEVDDFDDDTPWDKTEDEPAVPKDKVEKKASKPKKKMPSRTDL